MIIAILTINFSNGQTANGCYVSRELAEEAVEGIRGEGERFEFDDYLIEEVRLITKLPPGEEE